MEAVLTGLLLVSLTFYSALSEVHPLTTKETSNEHSCVLNSAAPVPHGPPVGGLHIHTS